MRFRHVCAHLASFFDCFSWPFLYKEHFHRDQVSFLNNYIYENELIEFQQIIQAAVIFESIICQSVI